MALRTTTARVDPSAGSVGDRYHNGLAEGIIDLFKAQIIIRLDPWKSKDNVEWQS